MTAENEQIPFKLTVEGKINQKDIGPLVEQLGSVCAELGVTFETDRVDQLPDQVQYEEKLVEKSDVFDFCDEIGLHRVSAGRVWGAMTRAAFYGSAHYLPPDASYWARIKYVEIGSLKRVLDQGFKPALLVNVGELSCETMNQFLALQIITEE